ncbi:uncharacterized protein LOC135115789 isoform X2 [Scylla paramamosain]|uniref:uncharacterized protein LOC135115789 isoform X2 n=1 Tax=Scylla paramamosain TaxID=85552 RepID=UPI00308367C8
MRQGEIRERSQPTGQGISVGLQISVKQVVVASTPPCGRSMSHYPRLDSPEIVGGCFVAVATFFVIVAMMHCCKMLWRRVSLKDKDVEASFDGEFEEVIPSAVRVTYPCPLSPTDPAPLSELVDAAPPCYSLKVESEVKRVKMQPVEEEEVVKEDMATVNKSEGVEKRMEAAGEDVVGCRDMAFLITRLTQDIEAREARKEEDCKLREAPPYADQHVDPPSLQEEILPDSSYEELGMFSYLLHPYHPVNPYFIDPAYMTIQMAQGGEGLEIPEDAVEGLSDGEEGVGERDTEENAEGVAGGETRPGNETQQAEGDGNLQAEELTVKLLDDEEEEYYVPMIDERQFLLLDLYSSGDEDSGDDEELESEDEVSAPCSHQKEADEASDQPGVVFPPRTNCSDDEADNSIYFSCRVTQDQP